MKLYYKAGACSLSPHIVAREAGLDIDIIAVDLQSKKTTSGDDFNKINPKSAIPFLVLDNGETLSEGVAIVQYLADLKPESKLAPKNGTWERSKLHEWLNYIATDVHKAHSPLFNPDMPQAGKDIYIARIKKAYDYAASALKGKKFLMGDQFTVADAYLFTVLGWNKATGFNLADWPALADYQKRISERPAVQTAMKAEGLLDKKAA